MSGWQTTILVALAVVAAIAARGGAWWVAMYMALLTFVFCADAVATAIKEKK